MIQTYKQKIDWRKIKNIKVNYFLKINKTNTLTRIDQEKQKKGINYSDILESTLYILK